MSSFFDLVQRFGKRDAAYLERLSREAAERGFYYLEVPLARGDFKTIMERIDEFGSKLEDGSARQRELFRLADRVAKVAARHSR